MVFAMVLAPPQIKMWPEEVDHKLIEAKIWLYHLLTFKERKRTIIKDFSHPWGDDPYVYFQQQEHFGY